MLHHLLEGIELSMIGVSIYCMIGLATIQRDELNERLLHALPWVVPTLIVVGELFSFLIL